METFRVLEIITGTKIVLNCGKNKNIKLSDKFEVYGLTKSLIDPDTKEDLGPAEIIRGKGIVTHIQDKLCTIESYIRDDEAKRVIKKTKPLVNVWTPLTSTEEEIIGEKKIKPFESIQVGDFARLIKT